MLNTAENLELKEISSHRVLFFAGNSMGEVSNKPIAEELQKEYPQSQIKTYNSVTTPEGQQVNHFEEIIQDLEAVLQSKSEATIIVYSMGAAEFCEAFFQLLERRRLENKKNPTAFEPMDLTKIHLIIRSPAGLIRGWKDRFRQSSQFVDLMGSMISGRLPILETLLSFPPKDSNLQTNQELILSAFRTVFGTSDSSDHSNTTSIPLIDEQFQDPFRTDVAIQEQKELQVLDSELLSAAREVSKNPQGFKEIAIKRAKFLQKSGLAGKALSGKLQAEKTNWEPEKTTMTAIGLLGLLRTFGRAFVGNDNQELLRWFSQKGMDIKVMHEEYGVFFTLKNVEEFFTLDDADPSKVRVGGIMELLGHTHVTLTNQPGPFATALRDSENQTRK